MKGWHRVTVLAAAARIGDCAICGPGVELRRRARRGTVEWSCMRKHRSYGSGAGQRRHRRLLGDHCEECGFVPTHQAQLDAHHLNGDHSDNRPQNVATLCANCHRLFHASGINGLDEAERRRQAGDDRHRPEDESYDRLMRSRLRVEFHALDDEESVEHALGGWLGLGRVFSVDELEAEVAKWTESAA